MAASGALLARVKGSYEVVPCGRRSRGLGDFSQHIPETIAFQFTTAGGTDYWITHQDSHTEAVATLKAKKLGFLGVTVVPYPQFKSLLQNFCITIMGSRPPLNFLVAMGKVIPSLMTAKTLEILQSSNHYRSTIADLMFHKGIDGLAALVYIERKKGERAEVPVWVSNTRHLTKSWFGCETLDDAVTVKLASPRATVIELENAQT